MKTRRIHIFGGSGSGVTGLGRAMADALALPHHDSDDYYWRPTRPPYVEAREPADRLRLMGEMFVDRPDWVLSGSLDGWGDPLIPRFDLVIFVRTPTALRLERVRAREARHFGAEAIAPGGWRHEHTEDFLEWVSHYDDRDHGRSLSRHEAWIAKLPCPVLRVDGARPVADLVQEALAAIELHIPLDAARQVS